MKRYIKIILISCILLFSTPSLVLGASPGIPHKFYGTVKAEDNSVPANGIIVEAKINGIVKAQSAINNGNYGYFPVLLFVLDENGDNNGKTINFLVNGIDSGETAIFVNGSSTNLNLIVPGTFTVPSPTPNTGSGGGGSGGGSSSGGSSSNNTNTNTNSADITGDNKIDVFDFNIVMIDWGKTGTNIKGDLDKNDRVDILDFNMLMINWTR